MTETASTEYMRLSGDGANLSDGDESPRPAATPFDDVEAIFAADLPGKRIAFEMLGQECWVELRPMDAQEFASYESAGSSMRIDPNRRTVETVTVDVDRGKQELALLLGTVVEFAFARRRRVRSGEEVTEMTLSAGMAKNQREQVFRTLSRAFRQKLVEECQRVNGIGPFEPS